MTPVYVGPSIDIHISKQMRYVEYPFLLTVNTLCHTGDTLYKKLRKELNMSQCSIILQRALQELMNEDEHNHVLQKEKNQEISER